MKDKMKIYASPENCNSLVVKKCNKEIGRAHLTSGGGANDLAFQKNPDSCAKRHCLYSGSKWFSKAEK